MKTLNLMKLFLSLLMVLTITFTNTHLIAEIDSNYGSQIELLSEDEENSLLIPRPRQ